MKNNFLKALIILILGTFLIIGCSSDDGGDNTNDMGCTNCYTYQNGNNPQTVQISSMGYATTTLGDKLELVFFTNNNDKITIWLEGNNLNEMPEGTFTSNSSPVYFDKAIHIEDGDTNYSVNGISRQITITKVGNNHKVNFEFTSGVGLTKGNYTGLMEEIQ